MPCLLNAEEYLIASIKDYALDSLFLTNSSACICNIPSITTREEPVRRTSFGNSPQSVVKIGVE